MFSSHVYVQLKLPNVDLFAPCATCAMSRWGVALLWFDTAGWPAYMYSIVSRGVPRDSTRMTSHPQCRSVHRFLFAKCALFLRLTRSPRTPLIAPSLWGLPEMGVGSDLYPVLQDSAAPWHHPPPQNDDNEGLTGPWTQPHPF